MVDHQVSKDFDALYRRQLAFSIEQLSKYPRFSLWKHYKGGLYQIVDQVMREATGEMEIIYRNINPERASMPYCYSRPVHEWDQMIETKDGFTPRYKRQN